MNKIKVAGFTLVEVIVFIVGLGILASTIMLPLMVSLRSSGKGISQYAAYNIAEGRMQLIRMQSRMSGFASTADICAVGSPPPVCSASTPSAYTVVSSITAAPAPYNNTSEYKQVTVTATGNSTVCNGSSQLIYIFANY